MQHEKNKHLILEIQKYFGGIGNWYLNKSDRTVRYQVTKQSDLLNVIIPFFMKHQLRSGKLLSFLHFKYIADVMATRAHWNNKKMLLSLIVIASHLNPLGKIGNKIKYLTPDEQKYVINNIQPEGIDISKLTESINNFQQNKLTLEFVHGLFETNTNNYREVSTEDQDFIRDNFLPKDVELWKFKEYYQGLNKTPPLKSFKDLGKRSFSTKVGGQKSNSLDSVVPIIKYGNADIQKSQIINENRGKSGIYRWTNLVNGKSYLGSSVDLSRRFTSYFNYSYLSSNKMIICQSLLKYGYGNFALEIIEYCDPSLAVSREQYYMDLLKPEYNILKTAGSSLGFKHSEETIAKLKALTFSPEHKAKLWTPEHKANHLEQLKTHNTNEEQKERAREWMKNWNSSEVQREKSRGF